MLGDEPNVSDLLEDLHCVKLFCHADQSKLIKFMPQLMALEAFEKAPEDRTAETVLEGLSVHHYGF